MNIARSAALVAAVLNSLGTLDAAERLPRAEARQLKSPIPYSDTHVREGRKTYLRLCPYCHGEDGKAQANPDFDAPSLRAPGDWLYGATDGELFVSIRDGAGHEMPPFAKKLSAEQMWQLVHFIRSIGPKDLRPVQGKP